MGGWIAWFGWLFSLTGRTCVCGVNRQLVVDGVVQLRDTQALDAVVPKLKDPVVREGLVRRVWGMEFVRQHKYRFTQPLLQVVAAHAVLATKVTFAVGCPGWSFVFHTRLRQRAVGCACVTQVLRLPNEQVDEICAAVEAGFIDVEGLDMNGAVPACSVTR